jgi:signal transduction histidine kinase
MHALNLIRGARTGGVRTINWPSRVSRWNFITRTWFSSLRARLSLLVVAAVLPCAGLILYDAFEQQRKAIADGEEDALRLAQSASLEHQQLLNQSRDLLVVLAQFPEQFLDPSSCRQRLAGLQAKFPVFKGVAVSDRSGKVLCSGLPHPEGMTNTDRPWFIRALKTKDFVISEYLIGRITQKPTLIVAQPALDRSGQVTSVLSAGLNLDWLQRLAAAARLPERAVITVTDDKGVILARHPNAEEWVGRAGAEAGIVKEILSRKHDGILAATGLDGVSRLYFFTRLNIGPAGELYFSVGISKADLTAPIRKIMWRNLAWLALVLLVGLCIANAGGKLLILNPLRALRDTARKLTAGDLTARVKIAGERGEIAELARSFNEMAGALETKRDEARQAQESLRTQALKMADLNMTLISIRHKLEAEIAEREQSERRIHTLYEVNAALNSTLALKEVLDILLEKAEGAFPYPSVTTVKLFNENTGALEALACRNLDEQEWKDQLPDELGGFAREAFETKAPVISRNAEEDPRAHPSKLYSKYGLVSYLGLPLIMENRTLGVLGFHTKEEHEFTVEEIELLTLLADKAAVAIHNAQMHEEILAGRRRLMELSRNLLQAQENERRHVATEIHDEIGQTLTALKLSLEMMPNLPPHQAKARLADSLGLVTETIAQVRALLQNLRPPMLDQLGLLPTLEWHFKRYTAQTQVRVKFTRNGSAPRFAPDIEIAAYRIVQEALNNVARHAGVKQARVALLYDGGTLGLEIEDRGAGFEPGSVVSRGAGNGISQIIERAAALGGRCTIQSSPGNGTLLRVDLPVENKLATYPSILP